MNSSGQRLAALRARLAEDGVDGFFLPRTDEYGSEYLPPSSERVAWLTGFTGSAAQVLVLRERAAVFTDGRYTVQVEAQVDGSLFDRCHITDQPPGKWLQSHMPDGGRIGYDPLLVRRSEVTKLASVVAQRGGKLVGLAANPVDAIWLGRPAPPMSQLGLLDDRYAGLSSRDKRAAIGQELVLGGADALLVTAADSIAWLLNARGRDIPYNPLFFSHLLVAADGTCRWFVDSRKLPSGLRLDNAIAVESPEALMPALGQLGGQRVLADPSLVHEAYLQQLEAGGAVLVDRSDPILLAKARKNAVEIEGAVAAQRRDGAAVSRFLAWLDAQGDGAVTEIAAADRLLQERCEDPLFQGESFPAISAHGPNASLPHYRAELASNRVLEHGTVYLIDSGGQYLDATTDITRTVALGIVPAEIRERFTLVLKGHIAIDQAIFPPGTTGVQLDTLARTALWRRGLDFDHGTGHGVGSYLCVHEGPARISKAGNAKLEPGMILSNEPGYYQAEAYGIRIENLLLVEERGVPDGGNRAMLGFSTLTLCPIDRRLIVPAMLDDAERQWLDDYHAVVRRELEPLLSGAAADWLRAACTPL